MQGIQEKLAAPAESGAVRSAPRSRVLIWPLAVFAVLAVVFAFALRSGDPSRLPSALIGKTAPSVNLEPLEGLTDAGRAVGSFTVAELADGHVSVVNFWASWCTPCVQEHPMLAALKERTGVRIYGVNYKDQPAAARRFLGRYGNPYTGVGVDRSGRAAIEWGVYGMPETFIVNGRGEIVYKHVGPIVADALERRIIPAVRSAQGR
ncbi:MAG TPA: DsbE family thiol:disulfide interchange protein [Hyphomicrobiaceae bacterium]|nr:DsbE family thiol:disulfide interchange protein [Hyphomicrobiaceae bacterium]